MREPADRGASFEDVFAAHRDLVTRYLVRRVGPEAAADLAAEVFVVLLRQPRPPSEPLPWLYAVAANLVRNHERRAAARAQSRPLEPTESSDPAHVATERLTVRAALDELAADDRELLRLVAWEGLNAAEAAKVLGCSPVALRVRLHRARRRFAVALALGGERAEDTFPVVLREAES